MNQLVKGQWPQNLAEDVKRRFDQWYKTFHPGAAMGLLETLQQHGLSPAAAAGFLAGNNGGGAAAIHHGSHPVVGGGHQSHLVNGPSGHHNSGGGGVGRVGGVHHIHGLSEGKSSGSFGEDEQHSHHHHHPVFHGFGAQKTRMRTSFDPEMELPKLQQW